jgi:tetratricopeptide (TPR) repeat protein
MLAKTRISAVPIAFSAIVAFGCPAWAQDSQAVRWCFPEAADRVSLDLTISGCTTLIQSGQESKKNLASDLNNRGIAYRDKGQYDRAIQDYDEAIRLIPNDGKLFNNRGTAYFSKGQFDRAIRDYDEAIRLDPKNAEFIDNRRSAADADRQRDLLAGLDRLGDVLRSEGKLTEARRFYEDALAIRKRLAERDPADADRQRDLSISLERLGDILNYMGKWTEARKFYEEVLAIRTRLAEASPANADRQREVSVSFDRLGDTLKYEGKLAEARKFYEDALAIRKRLADADPANPEPQHDLLSVKKPQENSKP